MTTTLRRRMHHDLQLAGLSERTQEAYLRAVRQLAEHFRTPPDRLTEQQLRDYLLHLKNGRELASTRSPACGGPMSVPGFLPSPSAAVFDTS